ncbi:hypothetical protein KQX54_018472 [Cotesia glomerata]|uniref:Uncharacterized protein n=1 Tax=Cotesia glomerata TaxID=32391 RepID=A0AAV7IG20_COTGL|nr:hypothetical protein KQX54_018472 [Cotesia glomerata]
MGNILKADLSISIDATSPTNLFSNSHIYPWVVKRELVDVWRDKRGPLFYTQIKVTTTLSKLKEYSEVTWKPTRTADSELDVISDEPSLYSSTPCFLFPSALSQTPRENEPEAHEDTGRGDRTHSSERDMDLVGATVGPAQDKP